MVKGEPQVLVSVIVPCYHGNSYIPGIVSMLERNRQQLPAGCALELVLVNDSPDIPLPELPQSCFQVNTVVNPHNCGIHTSRVNGLKAAEGEYILLLDQDDVITDNCIRSQLQAIGTADFVLANGYDMLPDGSKRPLYETEKKQRRAVTLSCCYYYNMLIRSPGQVLIKKNSIPAVWLRDTLSANGSDDAYLWILMLLDGRKPAVNPDMLYVHMLTDSNASANLSSMLASQLEVAQKLRGKADRAGMKAFERRARYYCSADNSISLRLRYADVGILRRLYAFLYL